MKKKIIALAVCVAAALPAFPVAMQAQDHDIQKRGQAMQECQVEGWRGYPSYEVCVEERYMELLMEYDQPDGPEYWGDGYGCSAESRICG